MNMQTGLRVLLTNNSLASRQGSELYLRDVALALVQRGHFPIAYSTELGEVADELRKATVPVLDDLAALNIPPDVIHGQHHLDAMTAMLRFPEVPAVYYCHGWQPWEEHPLVFPSIQRYIAVDDLCRERLLTTKGVAAEKVEVLYNFVDLDRFRLRAPLPDHPKSALVFSNYASPSGSSECITAACRRFGIEQIDVVGHGSGNPVARPEQILGQYDLVFGKARCALEAMASGCAVIVADFTGLGGMITRENVQTMRRLNFGVRTMQHRSITEETVLAELKRYFPQDARQVTKYVRTAADMSQAVDRLLEIYADIRAANLPDALGQCAAAADYLRWLAQPIKTRQLAEARAHQTSQALEQTASALKHAEARADQTSQALEQTAAALKHAEAQVSALRREFDEFQNSRAGRAVGRYRKTIGLIRTRFSFLGRNVCSQVRHAPDTARQESG